MLVLNAYFIGAYLTLLLFVLLLDINSFREYMAMLIESMIPNASELCHPYTYFWPFALMISIPSWIGFICLILLIVDWISWKKKN